MMSVLIGCVIISSLIIVGYRFLIRSQVKLVEIRIQEMKQLIEHNDRLVNNSKRINNHIELGVFQAKEHVLWMYSHYKDMLFLLCNVKVDDKEILDRAATATKIGMDAVAQNFTQTFGVTPEQYVSQKYNMTYTNQQGLSYPAPNAGVN